MAKRFTVILSVAGILLRVIPIWAMPTWYDENFTILVSRLPLDRLIAATAGDVHPPLWYLICWPLAQIPGLPSWIGIRLPALIAGIATIWIWWEILQVMATNERVKLAAFGLFCLLPQQIYYSQEGRMYSLLTLLVLSAWLAILHRRWIWLILITILMLWLHNYGLIYCVVLWLAALAYDRRIWKPLTISLAVAGLSFIPWVIVLLSQMREIYGTYWMINLTPVSVLVDLAHSYFGNSQLDADMVNFAVFTGLLVWAIIWTIRRRSFNLPLLILAFAPLALAVVISLVWQPIILFRGLVPSGTFIALILAQPVEYLGRKGLLLVGVFLVPALVVNLAGIAFRYKWADKLNLEDKAIEIIDAGWQDGDLLYFNDTGTFVTGAVSWENINNTLQIPSCGSVYGGLSPTTKAALGMRSGPLPIEANRIWVVAGESPFIPACENSYLKDNGLLNSEPVYCPLDNQLTRSCVYLVVKN